jgi:hypothetical protein
MQRLTIAEIERRMRLRMARRQIQKGQREAAAKRDPNRRADVLDSVDVW